MIKNNKETLVNEILDFFIDAVKVPAKVILETPYKCHISKKKIYNSIYSLNSNGYIKKDKNNFIITNKGKIKNWYRKLKNKKINFKDWDKKWRILFFDIPENKKSLREKLRRKLRILNFIKLQDSVWVTPMPVENDLEILSKILELKYFIRYAITEKINFDKDLRKIFFN